MKLQKKWLWGSIVLMLAVFGAILFSPNVLPFKEKKYLYIRTGTSKASLMNQLENQHIIKYKKLFSLVSSLLNLNDGDIHPGRYEIKDYTSSYTLIHKIKNNIQDQVTLDFSKIRTPVDLVSLLYNNLESDSLDIQKSVFDSKQLQDFGVDSMSLLAAFKSDKITVDWNSKYMMILNSNKEITFFWTPSHLAQAKNLGLTPNQVYILGSIVRREVMHKDEAPQVAAVYLNRLKKDMKLQADPTVVFANNDFEIKRVLNKHLASTSLFNTYKFKGLPPGPICTIDTAMLLAVLQPAHSNALFFCAKTDRSGYHQFFETYEQHLEYANSYHQSLDQRGIK